MRLRQNIRLIGYVDPQILGNKLPSTRQVLKVLFFNTRVSGLDIKTSVDLALRETLIFWTKARLKTRRYCHCKTQLMNLHKQWDLLGKNINAPTNKKREEEFCSKLDDLFDIAHQDALVGLDDIRTTFLQNQRKPGRVGFIWDIQSTYDLMEAAELKRTTNALQRLERMDQERSLFDEIVELASSDGGDFSQTLSQKTTSTLSNYSTEDNPGNDAGPSNPKKSRGTVDVINEKLVAVFDRFKVSDTSAVHLVASVAQSLGFDLNALIVNRSSIKRKREKLREIRSMRIKTAFQNTNLQAAVLHWDGKLLPDHESGKKLERLPVLITNCDSETLLGVPKLENGRGITQANAIHNVLDEWGALSSIKALCCDTTASNMGVVNGAAVLLEKMLEKSILYLPCRHHIFEIVLKSVFNVKLKSPSTGPDEPIFKRFKDSWSQINSTAYRSGIDDKKVQSLVTVENIARINSFVEWALKTDQPRADYKELLNLTKLFLGIVPSREVVMRSPGAMHHARFMSKAIYSLKIFLFRDSFEMTKTEYQAIRDVSIFIVTTYVEAWFTAPLAVAAPNHDLQFLRKLYSYESVDREIANAAMKKLVNHLWYLSPETVALSFFDENLPLDVKRRMVSELGPLEEIYEIDDNCPKKIQMNAKDVGHFCDKEMDHFVTSQTRNFLFRFGIDELFLTIDPSLWPKNASFQEGSNIVKKLKVVNDAAERAVGLFTDYNNILTNNETQKQYILQVVEEHRKRIPDSKKLTIMENL